ncbi:hypothetical protein HHI36_012334 [Cryptolaemus montrouzieri]|uniref:Spaetzle domain-containing protein n=1 Tax=Cryptolaemus montrouzieri TaxID=559131 RepID=A0ABD2NFF8_9CUCU
MRSFTSLITSFIFIMCHTRLSANHPFQVPKNRGAIPLIEDDTIFFRTMNWTPTNNRPKSSVPTFDMNKGFVQPAPLPDYPERSRHHRARKRKCVQNFCEEVDDYPETLIRNIVSRTHALDAYFREAEIAFELNNRGAFDEEDDSKDLMCNVVSATLYPQTAVNTKEEEKILVNIDGFKQGLNFETCANDDSPCRFSETLPLGYKSTCKQKYVKRNLAILGENNKTSWDTFNVPSCCVCVIKRE